MFLARHLLSTALVAAALAIVAGVFAFARPHYVPEHRSSTLDMAHRQHSTVQQVRTAFAHHGIRLDHGGPIVPASAGRWAVMLSTVAAPVDTSHLIVTVFGPAANVGWSDSGERYDALFRNVAVTYDGTSDDVLRRAKDVVAELRR